MKLFRKPIFEDYLAKTSIVTNLAHVFLLKELLIKFNNITVQCLERKDLNSVTLDDAENFRDYIDIKTWPLQDGRGRCSKKESFLEAKEKY